MIHSIQSLRNLRGNPNIYNIHGSPMKLDKLAESIEFTTGIEIIGCTDGADGTGLLTLETKRTEVLHQLIKEAGLMEAEARADSTTTKQAR